MLWAFLSGLSPETCREVVRICSSCIGTSRLSREVGISRTAVYMYAKGLRRPSPEVLYRVLQACSSCPYQVRLRVATLLEAEAGRMRREAEEVVGILRP